MYLCTERLPVQFSVRVRYGRQPISLSLSLSMSLGEDLKRKYVAYQVIINEMDKKEGEYRMMGLSRVAILKFF